MRILLLLLCAVIWSGCALTEQVKNTDLPEHHTAEGFKNLHIDEPDKSFFDFLRMRFFGNEQWADHSALADQVPFQQVNLSVISQPGLAPQVTWLGHSSFLIQYKGKTILTDPIFSDRASPFSFAGPERYVAHPMDYQQLPAIDAVVISHNHYDHLDSDTIQQLADTTHFVVPLKIGEWLLDQGIEPQKITELDWWQSTNIDSLQFEALPSQHWSARGLTDRFDTLWASWSIKIDDFTLWFAGDTGYNPVQFKQIGEHLGVIDLALIPIGAYAPRWFMQWYHVNPQEAVNIHRDVKSKKSIGMHWGTFPLTAEPPMEPPQRLAEVLSAEGLTSQEFLTLKVGETLPININ
jgi:N-acyl-phosphatidylethanolamine-hydrolysing phospholipase D